MACAPAFMLPDVGSDEIEHHTCQHNECNWQLWYLQIDATIMLS
jgi:hypothetical protein